MKGKLKRVMALVLAAVMVLSMAACGDKDKENNVGGKNDTNNPGNEDTKDPNDTKDPDKEGDITSWIIQDDHDTLTGTVRFWIPFKGTQGMDDMIADFNKVYPNVKVELNTYSNNTDGNVSVDAAIMSEQVDVLASFGLSNAHSRWANGLYQDLTPYIEQYNIDMVANWGSDVYKYDDTYYTFPCGGLSYYIAINETAWVEAGMSLDDLPTDEWTWDEYLAACEKMTKGEGDSKVYGGSDYHSLDYVMRPYGQVNGHDYFYASNGKEASFTDPLVINALKREIKAEQEDQIWFPLITYRSDSLQAQDTYMAGQTASSITCNMTRFIRDTEKYPDYDWVTYFAPYPVEEKGQENYMSGVVNFSHAGIATGCQDEKAAWAFLSWYSTYGVKYLVMAGHLPAWKGTDASGLVELMFETEENAAKFIDVDSYNRVVANYDNPAYQDTVTTAYSEVSSAFTEYMMYAHNGEMTVEKAMEEAKKIADEAIADELK